MSLSLKTFKPSFLAGLQLPVFTPQAFETTPVVKPISQALEAHTALLNLSSKQDHGIITKSELDALYVSTEGMKLHGIPLVHRLYFHVYDQALKKGLNPTGDRWGEFNALDDPELLKKSLKATISENYSLVIAEKAQLILSSLKKEDKTTLDIEIRKLISRFKPFITSDLTTSESAHLTLCEKIEKIKDKLLYSPNLTWATGTNSYTLLAMHAAVKTQAVPSMQLCSTGELLKHNLVPLSGELGAGIEKNGVNLKYLSGVDPSNLKGAIYYATESEFYFEPHKARDDLMRELDNLHEIRPSKLEVLNRAKIALLRVLLYTPLSSSQRQDLKITVLDTLSRAVEDIDCRASLHEIYSKLIDHTKPLEIDPQMRALFDSNAFPLVLASHSLDPDTLKTARGSSIRQELLASGPLILGEDIQVAITSSEHVETLTASTQGHGVDVMSFEEAQVLINHQLDDYALEPADDLFMA